MSKFENIILWILGIIEWLKTIYVRFFPPVGFFTAIVILIGFGGAIERGTASATFIFTAAVIYSIFMLLYMVFSSEIKLESRRRRR